MKKRRKKSERRKKKTRKGRRRWVNEPLLASKPGFATDRSNHLQSTSPEKSNITICPLQEPRPAPEMADDTFREEEHDALADVMESFQRESISL
jgi:hypothetical protein